MHVRKVSCAEERHPFWLSEKHHRAGRGLGAVVGPLPRQLRLWLQGHASCRPRDLRDHLMRLGHVPVNEVSRRPARKLVFLIMLREQTRQPHVLEYCDGINDCKPRSDRLLSGPAPKNPPPLERNREIAN